MKDRRQFSASKLVQIVGTFADGECAMKRILAALIAWFPLASAQAQAPEPPLESNPAGTIVFVVLFVGFCVVFAWMVWRNKDKDKKESKKP